MKTIKRINTIAILIPFVIAITYPFFKYALLIALLSTMVTGFLQFCIGVKMLADNPKNKNLKMYIYGVAFFFGLWLMNHIIDYNHFLTYILVPIPLILAIYLSLLIYKI
ncbi:hypothetical protein [Flavobacterium sp. LM4]|uniref:hypothetical protein n=1 Tax=Flavobacterium sp. LM4 TaxID=1938609 RepID=UPI0009946233|nr:hypothetical protein [Flavobacterium sp. LM4]OOV18272.1 hypothetical protein BXU10_00720 [Flavobacterium sp. LM4]